MLAVQLRTSKLTQILHIVGPSDQLPRISQSRAIGITKIATQRSLTARLTSRQLQGRRNFLTRITATQTKLFPIIVPITIKLRTRVSAIACRENSFRILLSRLICITWYFNDYEGNLPTTLLANSRKSNHYYSRMSNLIPLRILSYIW